MKTSEEPLELKQPLDLTSQRVAPEVSCKTILDFVDKTIIPDLHVGHSLLLRDCENVAGSHNSFFVTWNVSSPVFSVMIQHHDEDGKIITFQEPDTRISDFNNTIDKILQRQRPFGGIHTISIQNRNVSWSQIRSILRLAFAYGFKNLVSCKTKDEDVTAAKEPDKSQYKPIWPEKSQYELTFQTASITRGQPLL